MSISNAKVYARPRTHQTQKKKVSRDTFMECNSAIIDTPVIDSEKIQFNISDIKKIAELRKKICPRKAPSYRRKFKAKYQHQLSIPDVAEEDHPIQREQILSISVGTKTDVNLTNV